VQPVQLRPNELPRLIEIAPAQFLQVFQPPPIAQRIHLDAQHHGEFIRLDDGAGLVGRIRDLHPPVPRPARLPIEIGDRFLHCHDLPLDGAAIIGGQFRLAACAEQFVVDSDARDQAQPALISAIEPIDVGLLMH